MSIQDTDDFDMLVGSLTGAALTVDASDPNTVEPVDNRKQVLNGTAQGQARFMTLVADNGCVVELWIWSVAIQKWFKFSSTTIAAALTAQQVVNLPNGQGLKVTLRIQANAGSAKFIGAFFS